MAEKVLSGTILDNEVQVSLNELAVICSCRTEWIVEMVEEGIIDPDGDKPEEWVFTGTSLVRARTAIRLHDDLHINLPGIALVMDLLDEINELESRLNMLE